MFEKPPIPTPAAANDNYTPGVLAYEKSDGTATIHAEREQAIHRIADDMQTRARTSGEYAYEWGDVKYHDMRQQVSNIEIAEAILLVNAATDDKIRERPTFYLALLDLINAYRDSTSDAS